MEKCTKRAATLQIFTGNFPKKLDCDFKLALSFTVFLGNYPNKSDIQQVLHF